MTDEDTLAQVRGKTLVAGSDEVGEIEEVYTYAGADQPAVAAVAAETGTVLVPLADAAIENGTVSVGFDIDAVTAAPAPSGDALEEDEFEAVYAHYGISDADQRSQSRP